MSYLGEKEGGKRGRGKKCPTMFRGVGHGKGKWDWLNGN